MTTDSPIKAEIKVGEGASEKLIDAVIDTFSPATETLGLLGDAVRLARIEVAAAVTRRAKVIADEHGLRLKAPPLKFLVPYYEKASTEDLEDTELIEMWARLLVSAGSDYKARHLRYSALLSEMSATQARILDGIATNYDGVLGEDVDEGALFYNFVESRIISDIKRITEKDKNKIFDEIMQRIALPGVSVVLVQFEMKSDEAMYDWSEDGVYQDKLSIEFEILRSLGLLNFISTDFIEIKHASITVILYHMTELGYDFWSACCGLPSAD